jgi:hypothetical protein
MVLNSGNLNTSIGNIIIDAVEDYARRWIKREEYQDPELESLSDWVRTVRTRGVVIYA